MEPDHDSPATPGDRAASTVAALAEVVDDARFEALVQVLPQMLWITEPDAGVEYFSPRWEQFTGRPPEELHGKGYLDLVHPDDRAALASTSAADFDEGGCRMVFRLRRHDGEYRWMEAFGTTVRDDDGRILRFVGGTHDITERRRQEEAAREMHAQLESALEIANLGRFIFDLRAQKLEVDERVGELFGFGPGTSIPHPGPADFEAAIHPEDLPLVTGAIESTAVGSDYAVEYRARRLGPGGGGEERWVSARGRVEHDELGPVRMVGVVEDVTLRKREESLRELSQRRETLGALVGGIAHDFNNLLGAISSNAHLAGVEIDRGLDPRESLEEIRRGIALGAELVRRMLDYSREGETVRVPLVLGTVVHHAVSLVRPALPRGVAIRCMLPETDVYVLGDETQLHQVVVNLVTNAGQALTPTGGNIAVEVARASDDAVTLTVRDDGPGMEDAVARRAFEPFFTTKPAGQGTGLGLSTVRTIVRGHGGSITLQSAPGAGATYSVTLPVHAAAEVSGAPTASAKPTPTATPGDQIRVLYVDDEMALTRLAERALPMQGWATRTFTDPRSARVAFEADPQAFDVVVTDLSMPGLTGLELIAALRAARPGIPVVLTSGYLTSADREQATEQGVDAVLPKPCGIDELVRTIVRITGHAEA